LDRAREIEESTNREVEGLAYPVPDYLSLFFENWERAFFVILIKGTEPVYGVVIPVIYNVSVKRDVGLDLADFGRVQ